MKIRHSCHRCRKDYLVETDWAGREVLCPHCGASMRLPRAIADRTGPAGSNQTTGAGGPAEPAGAAGEGTEADLWPDLPEARPGAPAGAVTPADSTGGQGDGQGNGQGDQQQETTGGGPDESYDPYREFRRDLWRFIVPLRSKEEVPAFLCMLFLFCAWPLLNLASMLCCLSLFLQIAIVGCCCTFFANLVTDTARGVDQLPYFGSLWVALENFWSEIIVPTINMFGAFFYTQIPTIVVGAILMQFACSTAPVPVTPAGAPEPNLAGQAADMAAGAVGAAATAGAAAAGDGELELALWARAILMMTTLAGMFFLPMVLLILSFDAIGLLLRPDLIVRAIGCIWKPYLLGWLCLLGGVAVFWLAMKLVPEPAAGESGPLLGPRLLIQIPVLTLDLAVFLYAMRVIGLLYLHFEHLLPWTLEKQKKHPLEE